MKRILTIAFLFIVIVGYSQIPTPSQAWGNSFKRLFITQGDTVTTKIAGGLQVINGVLYIADGTKWAMVTGGSSTDSLTFATWRKLYQVNDSMKVVYNSLYNFTNGYGLNKSSLTFSVDTTAIQKKLSAGTGIAISGNTIYNTGSTSTGRVYAGNGLANVNDSTLKADTSILKTVLSAQNDSLTLAAAINAKPNFGDVRDIVRDSSFIKRSSSGLIIGNSTIATYDCGTQVGVFLYTPADTVQGNTYYNQAVPGDSIVGQMNLFIADANKATYDYVIIEIGLNDLDPTVTAAATLVKYQKLVDTIRTLGKSGVKILVSSMTPCKQRLIDVLGNTNGLLACQKWLDMNYAIMGGGANKITNVDYRINEHVTLLNDGNGNLLAAYDCGDGIHENNAARTIIASVWRRALNELGFLKVQQNVVYNGAIVGGSGKNYYDATNEAMVQTGSSSLTYSKVSNSSATGQSGFYVSNNSNALGGLVTNGSSFPFTGQKWAGNTLLFGDNKLMLLSNGSSASGGTDSVTITAGGHNNAPTAAFTNGVSRLTGTLGVSGATTLSSTLGVSGATTLSSTLGVTGAATFSSTGTFTGALRANGLIGINKVPSYLIDAEAAGAVNAVRFQIKNTSSGGDAQYVATNDLGYQVIYFKAGSTYSTYKIIQANDVGFYNSPQGGNVSILNDNPTGEIRLGSGSTSAAQFVLNSSGNVVQTGSLTLSTAGNKLNIATGTNASIGSGTLASGTATISTTAVTASSKIFIQYTSCASCGSTYISAKTAGTSFVVTSTNGSDASTFDWWIVN